MKPTREQAVEWARECGATIGQPGQLVFTHTDIEALVQRAYAEGAKAEREECAKICDANRYVQDKTAKACAEDIRARGQK